MQTIIKKMSELVQPEKNVRIHTEKQLQEFEKSVRMFGQIRPIIIDENNMILAGNGLYETLERMGAREAECYQYTNLTEKQKMKLMIADNKIFSLGIENLDTLNDFLVELQGDLDIPGFDEEILKQMIADADEVTDKIAEYGTLDDEEIRSIQAANEKREQKVYGGATASTAGPLASDIGPAYEPEQRPCIAPPGEQESTADVQKYVTCPKCGEKIWL